ncbi:hypothetical protein DL766_002583 [Monosporascus sp. MC13-8B]|nr:hypothetical protein DL763_010791 [Monosporascus cannonballus]RYP35311.1 hypothetical protein DL766_002583 [Monosporascus sp. MC13-8B]
MTTSVAAAPFIPGSRREDPWTFIGLASSFPNVELDGTSLAEKRSCDGDSAAGCKVFQIPRATAPGVVADDAVAAEEVAIREGEEAWSPEYFRGLKDQVLVFRYKGKFYAVDNRCPHSSYPLSNGTPFDIEDFGVVLSSGLTCPKHGWSFDLFTGQADRGNYRLGIWEVQLRPVAAGGSDKGRGAGTDGAGGAEGVVEGESEVWVRRKQRDRVG